MAAIDWNWLGSSVTDLGRLSSAMLSLALIDWAGLGAAALFGRAQLVWIGMDSADFCICLDNYIEVGET